MTNDLLVWVLLDWSKRVIADCEAAGAYPIPWTVRQTLAAVFEMLWKLDTDKGSESGTTEEVS